MILSYRLNWNQLNVLAHYNSSEDIIENNIIIELVMHLSFHFNWNNLEQRIGKWKPLSYSISSGNNFLQMPNEYRYVNAYS